MVAMPNQHALSNRHPRKNCASTASQPPLDPLCDERLVLAMLIARERGRGGRGRARARARGDQACRGPHGASGGGCKAVLKQQRDVHLPGGDALVRGAAPLLAQRLPGACGRLLHRDHDVAQHVPAHRVLVCQPDAQHIVRPGSLKGVLLPDPGGILGVVCRRGPVNIGPPLQLGFGVAVHGAEQPGVGGQVAAAMENHLQGSPHRPRQLRSVLLCSLLSHDKLLAGIARLCNACCSCRSWCSNSIKLVHVLELQRDLPGTDVLELPGVLQDFAWGSGDVG
mmetsp:Transcript_19224/g.53590  ORF Transcript_19224/g.53590 Transcript_19224/m.53590 type:complete len:281 (-) Transcript_19224:3346-4188(-)